MPEEEYIGDGVYASFDGYYIWLTTLEGMRIALEPSVFDNLEKYKEKLVKSRQENQETEHV